MSLQPSAIWRRSSMDSSRCRCASCVGHATHGLARSVQGQEPEASPNPSTRGMDLSPDHSLRSDGRPAIIGRSDGVHRFGRVPCSPSVLGAFLAGVYCRTWPSRCGVDSESTGGSIARTPRHKSTTKSACVVTRIETEGPHHGLVAEEPGESVVEGLNGASRSPAGDHPGAP
jgi:hypothetical protein